MRASPLTKQLRDDTKQSVLREANTMALVLGNGGGISCEALTEVATGWLRDAGMTMAMVETGGDPGHAPARRVYEKANYTLLPGARYFKAL